MVEYLTQHRFVTQNECGQRTEIFEIGHLFNYLLWSNIQNLSTLSESAYQRTPKIHFSMKSNKSLI